MCDLSDITAYLVGVCVGAIYPNGTSQPSVGNIDCTIFEGWPIPEQLDLDLRGQMLNPGGQVVNRPGGQRVNVSIFPMLGANVIPYQILDEFYVITPPTYGLVAGVGGNTLTLTGTPGPGEFCTIIADNQFTASATGASAAAIITALATQLSAFYGSVITTSSTLQLPTAAYFVARLGAPGVMGKVTHRQRHSIMITTWAPDHTSRTAIAKAVDNAVKVNNVFYIPVDNSGVLLVHQRTNILDEQERVGLYRRDLIFSADYATVQQFPGVPVTTMVTTISALDTVTQNFSPLTGAA